MSPFGLTGAALYAVIFLGKMLQEAFGVFRLLMVSAGKKAAGLLAGLAEVSLYITIVYSVLDGIRDDPLRLAVYAAAFAAGTMLGTFAEGRLALGYTSVQAVTAEADSAPLAAALRGAGYGVTVISGHSLDGKGRNLVFVQLRRRRAREVMDLIRLAAPGAVVSRSEVRSIRGGYLGRR